MIISVMFLHDYSIVISYVIFFDHFLMQTSSEDSASSFSYFSYADFSGR